jgi:hypothetical protein
MPETEEVVKLYANEFTKDHREFVNANAFEDTQGRDQAMRKIPAGNR